MRTYKLLDQDKVWIEDRLEHLNKQIKDLGEEFNEVLNQSSETWHDNAPFDAVVDKQSLLYAEYSHLKYIILNSRKVSVSQQNTRIEIGKHVMLIKDTKTRKYYISGDWTHLSGNVDKSGSTVISCQTPIAKELIGKKLGDVTDFGIVKEIV
jgi:transcription elongation GreA/GreB family factor